jgi:hypothetical protein
MSRSRRRSPVCGITCSESDRPGKDIAHRAQRAAERAALARGADVMPIPRETSNFWCFPKDGKQRFNPRAHPSLMRK